MQRRVLRFWVGGHHAVEHIALDQLKTGAGINARGKTIFKFHLDQRMKEARRLLKDSGLPTKVIAWMVGYDLTTSFITQFSLYFNYPPSKIQKKR